MDGHCRTRNAGKEVLANVAKSECLLVVDEPVSESNSFEQEQPAAIC